MRINLKEVVAQGLEAYHHNPIAQAAIREYEKVARTQGEADHSYWDGVSFGPIINDIAEVSHVQVYRGDNHITVTRETNFSDNTYNQLIEKERVIIYPPINESQHEQSVNDKTEDDINTTIRELKGHTLLKGDIEGFVELEELEEAHQPTDEPNLTGFELAEILGVAKGSDGKPIFIDLLNAALNVQSNPNVKRLPHDERIRVIRTASALLSYR